METRGRPSRLDRSTISKILSLVEAEKLTLFEAATRLNFKHVFLRWYKIGCNCADTPIERLTGHEVLCVEFYQRYQNLQKQQQRALMKNLEHRDECVETALLVRCLKA